MEDIHSILFSTIERPTKYVATIYNLIIKYNVIAYIGILLKESNKIEGVGKMIVDKFELEKKEIQNDIREKDLYSDKLLDNITRYDVNMIIDGVFYNE